MLPPIVTNPDPLVYMGGNYVVVDVEVDNSHGDYGAPVHADNRLLLVCVRPGPGHTCESCQAGVTRSKWGGELEQNDLLNCLSKADFIVAHNAKYELGWLRRCGLNLRSILCWDTMIGEYVLFGNLAPGNVSLSLDMCCRRRGLPVKDPVVDVLIKNGVNPVRIPAQWLEARCRQDVETTEQVFLSQRDVLRTRGLLPVQYTRCLLTPVVVDIEFEGMALDGPAVEKEFAEASARLAELSGRMDALTGGINWRSPEQVAAYVYDTLGFSELTDRRGAPIRTATGMRAVDQRTLDKLRAVSPQQVEFIALRKEIGKVNALLTKNLTFFRAVVDQHDGVFLAELHQTTTATHRLSSTGRPLIIDGERRRVQLQNVPRALKRLFRPKRTGWKIVEPDGAQLEAKCAAFLSQDDQMMLDCQPGYDFHVFTAQQIFGKSREEVLANAAACKGGKKDSWRQKAKEHTFKPLYGGRTGSPSEERYYKAFRARYPKLAAAQAAWIAEAVADKQYVTPWGLIYYFPHASINSGGYSNVTTAVSNYPVQALATAEIIPVALVHLWHRLGSPPLAGQAYIINSVHDSAAAEVHPDAVDAFIDAATQSWTTDVYTYLKRVYGLDFNVPLGVTIKVGDRWGTGEEVTFTIPHNREARYESRDSTGNRK